ncbi:MAG TPA: hypothetical protein PKA00_09025 [Saprospiraceae bacterium]|nr:hypothetical protein [Saprospiraceae bacterium]HMQ83038.1 hypothetical protein [Saprospiraceae bacterium]
MSRKLTPLLFLIVGLLMIQHVNAQTRLVAIPTTIQFGCLGTDINFYAAFLNSNLAVPIPVTDVNNSDAIIDIGNNCNNCSNGGFRIHQLRIRLINGTVGSTQDFIVRYEDENGNIINESGVTPSASGPGWLEFTYQVIVNDVPQVDLILDNTAICDGNPELLSAMITNSAIIQNYSWNAAGGDGSFDGDVNPGNVSAAIITDPDGYGVNASNVCGSDFDDLIVTENETPLIDLDCMDNGNNTTTITVNILNNASDVDVDWFNNGNPYSNSTGLAGPTSVSEVVSNVAFDMTTFTAMAQNGCGNATSGAGCLVFPVELLYFKGIQKDALVSLDWATASETNNDFFTLERSFDGRSFEQIAQVAGAGNSHDLIRYTFNDEKVMLLAPGDEVFYRLSQTDFDGRKTYFDLIALQLDRKYVFDLAYLHTENTTLKMGVQNPAAGILQVQVFNLNGQLIYADTPNINEAGMIELNYDISQWNDGLYLIYIHNGVQGLNRKFVLAR